MRATVPDLDATVEQGVRGLGGVDQLDVRGDQIVVHTKDSDAVARYLLTRTAARDLEITSKNLEDAFLALTGDDQ